MVILVVPCQPYSYTPAAPRRPGLADRGGEEGGEEGTDIRETTIPRQYHRPGHLSLIHCTGAME